MNDWKFPELQYTRPDFEAAKAQMTAWKERVEKASTVQDVLDVLG